MDPNQFAQLQCRATILQNAARDKRTILYAYVSLFQTYKIDRYTLFPPLRRETNDK